MKPNDPVTLLRSWITAVNDRDAEKVLSLYDEDALLLPTFSAEIFRGVGQIKNYFKLVYKNDRVTVKTIDDTLVARDLGEGVTVLGGLYYWVLARQDTIRKQVARYTFCIDTKQDRPILHHHSSELPGS